MHAAFALTPPRRPRIARESLPRGFAVLRAAGRRAPGNARRHAPSICHRLPPTRAARASRSCGVFFAPGKRMLSGVLVAVALLALAAMLGTTRVVDSASFIANAGPRLVASASLAPAAIASVSR